MAVALEPVVVAVAVEPVVIVPAQFGEGSEVVVHKTASGGIEQVGPGISLVLIEAPTGIGCIVAEVGGIVAERDQEASFGEFHGYVLMKFHLSSFCRNT